MTTAVIVLLVVLLLVAALRLWLTASRLDRLHVRTEAAWAALEGALSRRVVVARAVSLAGGLPPEQAALLRRLARLADSADKAHRADAENDLTRRLAALPAAVPAELLGELADANERVVLARRFYNDAVRDTRSLRAAWFTRMFRLAGRAVLPDYFEIAEFRARPPHRRTAARVVLLDRDGRVLLFRGSDPDAPAGWWITPGGGLEGQEDLRAAAVREVAEETGMRLEPSALVGPLWRRIAEFDWDGSAMEQTEFFFVARAASAEVDTAGFTELERRTLTAHRWWTPDELRASTDQIYPVELSDRLTEAVAALSAARSAEPAEIT